MYINVFTTGYTITCGGRFEPAEHIAVAYSFEEINNVRDYAIMELVTITYKQLFNLLNVMF